MIKALPRLGSVVAAIVRLITKVTSRFVHTRADINKKAPSKWTGL